MSKYKVGDKVLLQGEVIKIKENNIPYPYGIRIAKGVEFMFGKEEMISKTYEDGLADAWELARKIVLQPSKGGMPGKDMSSIFGERWTLTNILKNHTPQQALAKIEAYEKAKEIKVGDVVRSISSPDNEYLVITKKDDESVYEYGVINLTSMTIGRITGSLSKFEKTGRTVDIQHILEQIRGNE